jgi:hypothetical protein
MESLAFDNFAMQRTPKKSKRKRKDTDGMLFGELQDGAAQCNDLQFGETLDEEV